MHTTLRQKTKICNRDNNHYNMSRVYEANSMLVSRQHTQHNFICAFTPIVKLEAPTSPVFSRRQRSTKPRGRRIDSTQILTPCQFRCCIFRALSHALPKVVYASFRCRCPGFQPPFRTRNLMRTSQANEERTRGLLGTRVYLNKEEELEDPREENK
jgi:hypothetical protein